MSEIIKKGSRITILGAGNVGATIAYTLTLLGGCSDIVLIDINKDKAKGEAMDIRHGSPFCNAVDVYDGDYADAAGSDIVIVTVGIARKPGQTRLELAKINAGIMKDVMPKIAAVAPHAIYVIVSNPVDILTYTAIKCTDLLPSQVIGTGTMLDTSRLRSLLADHVKLSPRSVHAYVFGEHGDTSMIPWSLTNISGMVMSQYCSNICERHNTCGKVEIADIENDVRLAGAEVIKKKGATFYAIALTVNKICDEILRDTHSVQTVSTLIDDNTYGINDVCLSLPCVIGGRGLERRLTPPLLESEMQQLHASADALKAVLKEVGF